MQIKNFINTYKLFSYYIVPSFTYGFLRGVNSDLKPPQNVIGTRILFGLCNGMMYATPPYCAYYQFKLINRIDIHIMGKDKEKYKDCYEDMFSNNMNTFF
jgi:hypothetical protein